jgi:hypothetical protein
MEGIVLTHLEIFDPSLLQVIIVVGCGSKPQHLSVRKGLITNEQFAEFMNHA